MSVHLSLSVCQYLCYYVLYAIVFYPSSCCQTLIGREQILKFRCRFHDLLLSLSSYVVDRSNYAQETSLGFVLLLTSPRWVERFPVHHLVLRCTPDVIILSSCVIVHVIVAVLTLSFWRHLSPSPFWFLLLPSSWQLPFFIASLSPKDKVKWLIEKVCSTSNRLSSWWRQTDLAQAMRDFELAKIREDRQAETARLHEKWQALTDAAAVAAAT